MMPNFFIQNIKNIGYKYHSDLMLTYVTYFTVAVSFVVRLYVGILADKYGPLCIWKYALFLGVIALVVLSTFMHNITCYYICIALFFAVNGTYHTLIASISCMLYGQEIGIRLQGYMFLSRALSASGLV